MRMVARDAPSNSRVTVRRHAQAAVPATRRQSCPATRASACLCSWWRGPRVLLGVLVIRFGVVRVIAAAALAATALVLPRKQRLPLPHLHQSFLSIYYINQKLLTKFHGYLRE